MNICKPEVMSCQVRISQAEESGTYPTLACASRVLKTILLSAMLVTDGFIKDVVVPSGSIGVCC